MILLKMPMEDELGIYNCRSFSFQSLRFRMILLKILVEDELGCDCRSLSLQSIRFHMFCRTTFMSN